MTNKLGVAILLLFAAAACDRSGTPSSAPALPPVAPAAPAARDASGGSVALPQLDFSALAEKEGPAVVNISTVRKARGDTALPPLTGIPEDDPFFDFFRRFAPPAPRDYRTHSLGSGFLISRDGVILTNAHVIDEATEVTVKLTDRREFKAKVIGADPRSDVAVLKIDAKGLPAVTIGDPARTRVGEWVVAIGSPFGFENSVTAGIISAKGRQLPDETYVPFLQADVPINPGNSGGPLFNLRGEVIGINSQIYSRTGGYMGLSFAIPIDVAMNVADQLRQSGKVTRGRLGVRIQDVNTDLAHSFGMERPDGALIAAVEPRSPAAQAGLRAGDVILSFDGKPIKNATDLPVIVASTAPGKTVNIDLWRERKRHSIEVRIAEAPADSGSGRR